MYTVTLSAGDQDTAAGTLYHLEDARDRARELLTDTGTESRVFVTSATAASYTERFFRRDGRLLHQVWSDSRQRFVAAH
jgi:hypothetical protein